MRIWYLAALFALVPIEVGAQSTATQVVPGYLTTTGCPGGQSVCFVQSGSAAASGGTVIANPPGPQTYATTPDSYSVTTSSTQIVAAGAYSANVQFCTAPTATANVWLNTHCGTAASNSGVPVYAGSCTNFYNGGPLPVPTACITAITDGGSSQTISAAGK